MSLAVSGSVLVEDDIEHPVELVLDGPMGSNDLQYPLGWDRLGEQDVSGLGLFGFAVESAPTVDLGQGADAGEVVALGQGGVGDDLRAASLAAAMAGAGLGAEALGLLALGKAALDRPQEGPLVSQDVLAAGLEQGPRHGAMAMQGIDGDDAVLERQQLDRLQGAGHLVAPRRR